MPSIPTRCSRPLKYVMTINTRVVKQPDAHFALRPQRVAWLVVLVSFVCFCTLGTVVAAGIYWFIFDSNVPLTVRLVVSQGNVIVQPLNGQPIGILDTRVIDPQTQLIVADGAQGV